MSQYSAYQGRKGFSGLVIRPDSIGVRMELQELEALRESFGIGGASWTLTGLPPSLDADQLVAVLKASGWTVETPSSRRVQKGRAMWRVRAKQAPPLAILPIEFEKEKYSVGISRSATQAATSAEMSHPSTSVLEARIAKLETNMQELAIMPTQMASFTKSIADLASLVNGLTTAAGAASVPAGQQPPRQDDRAALPHGPNSQS